jgi:hypothetical protein
MSGKRQIRQHPVGGGCGCVTAAGETKEEQGHGIEKGREAIDNNLDRVNTSVASGIMVIRFNNVRPLIVTGSFIQ